MTPEFYSIVNKFFEERYPFKFNMSLSLEYKLYRPHRDGEDILPRLQNTLRYLKRRTNYPFYWYDNGFSVEESFKYANEVGWRICPVCAKAYHESTRYKSCCSIDCYTVNRQNGNKKLSASRLLYNPRDPIQYSQRHNISQEEAEKIVHQLNITSTMRRPEYWMERGYSDEDSIKMVSEKQSKVSKRCVEYYIDRGYSQDESEVEVSNYQSDNANKRLEKYTAEEIRKQSAFTFEFWEERGITYDEYKSYIKHLAISGSEAYLQKYSKEERRKFNVLCIEYWKEKFPDTYIEEYTKFRVEIVPKCNTSKKANNFFIELKQRFPSNRVYTIENEFASYIKDYGCVFYDYVDTTLNVCVEFHGNYWHGNPKIYESNDIIYFPGNKTMLVEELWEKDLIKQNHIIERGFTYYNIWESEFDNNENCLDNLYRRIVNENC